MLLKRKTPKDGGNPNEFIADSNFPPVLQELPPDGVCYHDDSQYWPSIMQENQPNSLFIPSPFLMGQQVDPGYDVLPTPPDR